MTAPPRYDRLDALRGAAIVWMAIFHFFFDLDHFKLIRENFYTDPFWTVQRTCIVTLFLFTAGLSQAVALSSGRATPVFSRRWVQVAACALLVSIGSAVMFPKSWISFGVLHAIAVALVVMRLTGRWPSPVLVALGAVAVALPLLFQHPFFDSRWTWWIGFTTHKPITEDYVPLLPWLGVMWWGLAAGRWVLARRAGWMTGALARPLAPLATLGRWSLSFYMVHQPVLIGLIMAVVALRAR